MPDGGPVNPGLGLGVATDEIGINLTGTVAKNGTTTLTGTSTLFLSQLSVGQVIRVPGTTTEDRIVSAIASDTSLTVSAAFVNTASGQTAQRVVHYQYVKLVDGTADATTPAAFVSGRVDVNIGGASAVPTVSNAETIADNAGFTDGTSKVFPAGLIFDESAGTALTENDVGASRMDSKRASVQVLEDGTTRGTRATIKAASTAVAATDTAQSVGLHPSSPVPLPTLTKGTQGATGITIQPLKDAGRQAVMLAWLDVAGTAAVESALTNFSTGNRAGTALTAATSYTVSSGKTLRIQSVMLVHRTTSTVLNQAYFRIRQAASSIANTSPIIFSTVLGQGSPTTAAGTTQTEVVPIPDGLEIAATQQITFTWLTSAATSVVSIMILGYEY